MGRPEIQEFVGALAGNAANPGLFLATSSRFSAVVRKYADQVQARVALIDGPKLSQLLNRYRVACGCVAQCKSSTSLRISLSSGR